jgi:non-ribosomal peptide synthetase component E (peptide arylation enzyme)
VPLDTLLARHATCRRDRLALVFGPHRLTHAEVDRRANRTANGLAGKTLRRVIRDDYLERS